MMEFLRDGIWQFIGALIATILGLIAIAISIQANKIQNKEKRIRYKVHHAARLVSTLGAKQLQVIYKDMRLHEPYIVVLEIENNGDLPIPANDYERPLSIRLYDEFRLISAEVLLSDSAEFDFNIPSQQQNRIDFQPVLLNPGDIIIVQIIADKSNIEKELENVSSFSENPIEGINARITGVSKIEEFDLHADFSAIIRNGINRIVVVVLLLWVVVGLLLMFLNVHIYLKLALLGISTVLVAIYMRNNILQWTRTN